MLSDEGPMLETLDCSIRIGSAPTIFRFVDTESLVKRFIDSDNYEYML